MLSLIFTLILPFLSQSANIISGNPLQPYAGWKLGDFTFQDPIDISFSIKINLCSKRGHSNIFFYGQDIVKRRFAFWIHTNCDLHFIANAKNAPDVIMDIGGNKPSETKKILWKIRTTEYQIFMDGKLMGKRPLPGNFLLRPGAAPLYFSSPWYFDAADVTVKDFKIISVKDVFSFNPILKNFKKNYGAVYQGLNNEPDLTKSSERTKVTSTSYPRIGKWVDIASTNELISRTDEQLPCTGKYRHWAEIQAGYLVGEVYVPPSALKLEVKVSRDDKSWIEINGSFFTVNSGNIVIPANRLKRGQWNSIRGVSIDGCIRGFMKLENFKTVMATPAPTKYPTKSPTKSPTKYPTSKITRQITYFTDYKGTLYTFAQAKDYCRNKGGQLAEILNAAENSEAEKECKKSKQSACYIGLTDTEKEGHFRWLSGASILYKNWAPNEPNNAGGNEHCGSIFTNSHSGKWNDYNCGVKIAVLCEKSYKVSVAIQETMSFYSLGGVIFGFGVLSSASFYLWRNYNDDTIKYEQI